uniref:Serine/threonine-protein kinase polo (inferred by orthology to a D. melanogaster protein) n=1 Tax=Strongyloides venezuelensis TaxID=75913 RepID=A0A0K0G287_STRVS
MFRIEDFEEVLEGIPETIQDPITGNQYNREKFLGKGASGKCYLFTDLETRKKYAGKIIMMNTLFNELDMIHNETSIQKSLRHQNIIRMFGHFDCSRYTCMILELCDGTLEDVLERLNFLDEPSCRFVVREVARGISYLHEKQIIHRDIKPDNIFLTKDMDVKIGDFGIAIRHEDPTEKIMESCGTRIYLSPESLNRYGYSFGVDVWALGVTLYKMIVGYVSFDDWFTSVFYEITKIRDAYIAMPSKVPLHTGDMIKILMTIDPNSRPTIDDVLKCDYLNSNSISKDHLQGYISGKPISYDINQNDLE